MKEFNYDRVFEAALKKIKLRAAPHSSEVSLNAQTWMEVKAQSLFQADTHETERYIDILNFSHLVLLKALEHIIVSLLRQNGYNVEYIKDNFEKGHICYNNILALADYTKGNLLIFKEIEESLLWRYKVSDEEPDEFLKKYDLKKAYTIYFMFEDAYKQIINYDKNAEDPGRDFNIYSIRWFFEEYFGPEEYSKLYKSIKKYSANVDEIIEWILVKPLASESIESFRRLSLFALRTFNYKKYNCDKGKNLSIGNYLKIRQQFIDENIYEIIVGSHDYAESFISAEWLYSAMKKAKAIDLTSIATSYFKTTEQLVWKLICLHKDEKRLIRNKKNKNRKELNTVNINSNSLDSTLGSMAIFLRDNMDVFRSDLDSNTKEYVKETVFEYTNIRNGYSHKDNIKDWKTIDEIRGKTINIIFLLLGSFQLTAEQRIRLGYIKHIDISEYQKLAEYFHFHAGDLFYADGQLIMAQQDFEYIINNNVVEYSGIYCNRYNGSINSTERLLIEQKRMPKTIYLVSFECGTSPESIIDLQFRKIKKVFENGKYLGPSVFDESLTY